MDKTVLTIFILASGFVIPALSYYQLQDHPDSKIWKLFGFLGIVILILGIYLVLGLL